MGQDCAVCIIRRGFAERDGQQPFPDVAEAETVYNGTLICRPCLIAQAVPPASEQGQQDQGAPS